MEYSIKSFSTSKKRGSTNIKETKVEFGTTPESSKVLASPAELFLNSFSACIIKNVERFSMLMNFEYSKAEITVKAIRKEKPPRMDEIEYVLKIYSQDNKLNINLLKKNIEKFGTIFNTVKSSCSIKGVIEKMIDEE
jgi:uncharacterized OsmC-like protein